MTKTSRNYSAQMFETYIPAEYEFAEPEWDEPKEEDALPVYMETHWRIHPFHNGLGRNDLTIYLPSEYLEGEGEYYWLRRPENAVYQRCPFTLEKGNYYYGKKGITYSLYRYETKVWVEDFEAGLKLLRKITKGEAREIVDEVLDDRAADEAYQEYLGRSFANMRYAGRVVSFNKYANKRRPR